MAADFKCYPSPQQNTGVFILNGAMYAVIACDIVLLFFTLSAQLLLFSCSDQRISISSLCHCLPLTLCFHALVHNHQHKHDAYLIFMLLVLSLFLALNVLKPTLTMFPSSLRFSPHSRHLRQSLLGLIAHQLLSGFDVGQRLLCVCSGFSKLNLTHQLLKHTLYQHHHICQQH